MSNPLPMLNRFFTLLLCLLIPAFLSAQSGEKKENTNLLVFTKTAGYRHQSIDEGVVAVNQMGSSNNWEITVTKDANHFTEKNLNNYDAVVFLSTTGDVLNDDQQNAFTHYINHGGGYVGVHAASDMEYEWPWYGRMIGGYFKSHPHIQKAKLNVHKDCAHPAVEHLGKVWTTTDEWYNFKKPVAAYVNVLLDLDESTYEGQRMGGYHPIAWYHHFEGGRVFYTGLGHSASTFRDEQFLPHLEEGIKWATGMTNVPISEEWTDLLDPELSHWDKFIGVPHVSVPLPDDVPKSEDVHKGTPLGVNNDPLNVFSMIREEGEDVLKVNGQIYGGLTSKQEFGDYHLQLQFKWGDKKWEPRLEDQRDNGLLYHCTGPHGAFWNVWMRCLEFQIQERDMGDFFALGGANATAVAGPKQENGQYAFVPGGEGGNVGWATDNYRSSRSTNEEKPHGEWNTVDLYTVGGTAIHVVNGKVVNAVKDAFTMQGEQKVPLLRGKVQLQSEAADSFFRRVRVRGIKEIPAEILKGAGL